ncbi:phospholipid-binding lipoprotein MlaA [Azospirillaceae bacterium]
MRHRFFRPTIILLWMIITTFANTAAPSSTPSEPQPEPPPSRSGKSDGSDDRRTKPEDSASANENAKSLNDPYEDFNRTMHEFNVHVYGSAAHDTSDFFTRNIPPEIRLGVNNFFANLGEPITAVSSLIRGELDNADAAGKRFLINTTLGFGGVVDRATEMGIRSRPQDIGQAICTTGVPEGPYLVLPFYGPATLSDFVGSSLPIVAGYIAFGEIFWAYRASSRVATYIESPETGQKSATTPDYLALRQNYMTERQTQCQAPPDASSSSKNDSLQYPQYAK